MSDAAIYAEHPQPDAKKLATLTPEQLEHMALDEDELEDLERQLDEEPVIPDEADYYAVLNVSRTASDEEIKDSYKRLCLVFHPDRRQSLEDKMKAESKFQMIQRAYDCLSDANSRYLYDKYGPEATVASWQLSKKFKSAKEMAEEYERSKREFLPDSVMSSGELTVALDVSRVFDPPVRPNFGFNHKEELPRKSRGLAEIAQWPSLSYISVGHAWDAKITPQTNFILKGSVVARGSLGSAAISTTIQHTFSSIWTGFLTGTIGSAPQMNGGLIRSHGAGFAQLVASTDTFQAPPRLSFLIGHSLTQTLSMNVGAESGSFAIGNWGEEQLGLSDSAFICGLVKRSGKDFFNMNVRFGVHEAHVALEYSTPLTKSIRGKLALGLSNRTGASTTLSASRKITKNIRLGLGLEIAALEGVTFQIRFVRLGQKLNIPLFLSPDYSLKVISLALMIPAVVTLATDRWYFAPRKRLHFIQKLKQIREENAERLQQRKEQAQEAIELMTESANRKHSIEFSKEGLVIVEALYGKLPPSNFDAVQPLSSRGMRNMADNLSRQLSSPFLGTPPAQLETESTGEYIDVTIPIKNLVSNSQIYIAGGHSKSSLLGFYDPCFGESKRLRITYKFHGRVHMVEVDDRAPVAAPLRAHVV